MPGANTKNIVLCADGTGNSGGKGFPTNVWRLFNAVDMRCHEDAKSPKQLAFYDDGVGTEDFKLLRLVGSAFGWGLSRNIRELYETLARNYTAGDKIFVFGFSRGAFTARSLAGLIAHFGVVDLQRHIGRKEYEALRRAAMPWRSLAFLLHLCGYFRFRARKDKGAAYLESARIKLLVNAAFNSYRQRHKRHSKYSLTWIWFELLQLLRLSARSDARGARTKRRMTSHDDQAKIFKSTFSVDHDQAAIIQCVGVWDTLGALGAPADWMRWVIDKLFSISFHDQSLHSSVRFGFHALAIDDDRGTFAPVLWKEPARSQRGEANNQQHIEQVWFAGAHSNVGGGYPKQGLASVSLYWMMLRAQKAGLLLMADELKRVRGQANAHDKLYDPRAGLAAYYSYAPRDIAALVRGKCFQDRACIHHTVFDRIASGVQDYIPANLPDCMELVGDNIGDAPTEDRLMLEYWKERLERAGISTNYAQLAKSARAVHKWIILRKALYVAMLTASLIAAAIALGLVLTDSSKNQARAQTVQASEPALHTQIAEPNKGNTLMAAAVRVYLVVEDLLVPTALQRALHRTLHFFAKRPGLSTDCLALMLAYLLLRAWFEARTRASFEQFWSPLRGPLPNAADSGEEPKRKTGRPNSETRLAHAPRPSDPPPPAVGRKR